MSEWDINSKIPFIYIKLQSASDGEHSENRSTRRNVKEEQGQFTNFMN